MSLPEFKDYNPGSPWAVTGEPHTIDSAGRIRLKYVPLQGTGATAVSIAGYAETTSSNPGLTEFYIDYQVATAYRTANGYVQFSLSAAGNTVSVNYYGVSTVIWADQMNELAAGIASPEKVASTMHEADGKTTLATADELPVVDSAASNGLKKVTVENLKQTSLSAVLTGFTTVSKAALAATDTILGAFQKLSAWVTDLWGLKWSEKFVLVNPAAGYVSPPQRLTRNGTGYNFYFDPVGTVASTYINIFKGDRNYALGASLDNSATTMTLDTVLSFSGTPLCLIDANGTPEVVQLTAGSGTTSLTIVRAQGGSTAAAHNSGGYILPYVGQVAISSNAPVTYDASGITGTADDWICLNNTVANTALKITANMKWVNR